jgi:dTDP-4-amino-4,6-dideoxygalactose transaminase
VRVPLVDLRRQHEAVADAIADGWRRVLDDAVFLFGDEVASFESELAAYCDAAHCVAVANGTDALELTLRALGIGPGDEVVVPATTFVATAMAVVRAGAVPVFADVVRETCLVEPRSVEEAVSERTRAIVPVHLFGQMADVDALRAFGVPVVEDAAQAHGATQHGRPVAASTAAAAFSFYPTKNLGAYGDGGAVLTNDDAVATRVRRLRNYGGEGKYEHVEAGFNSRLDALQAVVLRAKLARLDEWNEQRRAAAARYGELLAGVDGVELPAVAEGNDHAWHLYVVQVDDRDRVLEELRAAGVGAAVHYPTPLPRQRAFAGLDHGGRTFPVADDLAGRVLSVPIFPGIREDEQDYVADVLRRAVRKSANS